MARLTGTALVNSGGVNLDVYNYGYNQASQRTNVVRTTGDSVGYPSRGLFYFVRNENKTSFVNFCQPVLIRW
jgi:hypothetical protein